MNYTYPYRQLLGGIDMANSRGNESEAQARERRRQKQREERQGYKEEIQKTLDALEEFSRSIKNYINDKEPEEDEEELLDEQLDELDDSLKALAYDIDSIIKQIRRDRHTKPEENFLLADAFLKALHEPTDSNIKDFEEAAEPTRLAAKAHETARRIALVKKALVAAVIMAIATPVAGLIAAPFISGFVLLAAEKLVEELSIPSVEKKAEKETTKRDLYSEKHGVLWRAKEKIRGQGYQDFHTAQKETGMPRKK